MTALGAPPPGSEALPDPPEPERQVFPDIVQDIFPSCELHLIGGSRGAGKTAFEVWLCRSVLHGEEFLGHKTWCPPAWAVLVFDRTSADRLAWWRAAGIEPLPYRTLDNEPVTPEVLAKMPAMKALEYLQRHIDALSLSPGSVLVIDVLNFVLGDSHLSYRMGFAIGRSLAQIAHDRQLTIFGLVHGGKQKGGSNQYVRLTDRIIASTGFLGTVATCSYLTTPEESDANGKQHVAWEPHHHKAEKFTLRRTADGFFEQSEFDDVPDAPIPKEVKLIHDGEEILAAIPDEGITAADLRKALPPMGVKQTFFNRLTDLRLGGYVKVERRGKQLWVTRAKPEGLQES